jgi:hypothetical protein
MRTFALVLLLVVPCSVAVALPSGKPSHTSSAHRPIHVVLLNMSGQRRHVELTNGVLDLPSGRLTVLDSRVGFTLNIASDTHDRVDERILLKEGDDARILRVR